MGLLTIPLDGAGRRRSFSTLGSSSGGAMSVTARRGFRSAALIAALVGSVGFAGSARAQLTNAPVDLQIFRPAMDSKGFITLNSSAVLGQFDTSFGLVVSYAHKPLTLNGGQMFGGQQNQFD